MHILYIRQTGQIWHKKCTEDTGLPGEEIPPAVVTSGGKEGELVMASVKYDIEVQVSRVSVSRLLSEYWNPDPVREACKLCPE